MTLPSPNDIHRPAYHFLPAANWMNDPNGVIQWRGRYHLFFQYNPDGPYHANMHWGHAVSDDLIHWEELPIAIAPSPNSPDQGGIFSGCVVNDNGTPTAIYTGVNDDYSLQTQCIATGNEDLTRWRKYAGNPVIGEPPAHLGQTRDFRDPFVWRREGAWYMTISAHIAGVGGAVLLYRSHNLTDWEYLHPLFVGDRARHGRNFECANCFPLGDKWVMIISVMLVNAPAYTLYWVGRWENERFIVESEAVYDAGVSYASLTHLDESGRPLIYSWLRESRSVELQKEAGWTGVQAIPRVLSLDSRNRLISRPVPEVETLRGRHQHFATEELSETAISVGGLALDIEAAFDAQAATNCGIEMSAGNDKLAVVYERRAQTLQVHRRYRQPKAEIDSAPEGIVHALDDGETLQLRLLLDGSVLEVIANGRTRITSRFYPDSAETPSLRMITPAAALSLDVWEMALRV